MCDFLDNYNFDSVDVDNLSKVVKSVTTFLKKAESYYATTVLDRSVNEDEETEEDDTIASKTTYVENFLDGALLQKIKNDLPQLTFMPTGRNQPDVSLFGEERYVYSKATVKLSPQPLSSSAVGDVLDCVNWKFGTSFNSVLVNRYANKNISLDWHQDDEPAVDQSHPIITLSVGATRRFWVSDSKTKDNRTESYVERLKENSVFVMKPGLQETHYHKLDIGRSSRAGEC